MGDIYHAGEVYAGSVPIDDTQASEDTVYSSAKVESMIEEIQAYKKENLSSTHMILPTGVTLNGSNYYEKYGRIVVLHVDIKIVLNSTTSSVITGYLPTSDDCPTYSVIGVLTNGAADGLTQTVTITPQGGLTFWNTKTGTTYAQGTITYIAKA